MAIYHLEAKIVSRGVGRSAVAASAYMSCARLYNEYDGIQHDYTRKQGLVWQQTFLPDCAPAAWHDREILWNAVEEAEKTKDSRLAREFVVALPVELDRKDQIALLEEYIQAHFVADGMCADAAIHDPDGHNPHAHILLTVRPWNDDGTWQYKTEKEYLCVRGGEERGFTAAEFRAAQSDGWEKQYPYKVGKKKVYILGVLQGVQTVAGFYAVYQGRAVAVALGIDEVNAGLVERHRVGGGEDADVVHIRLGGVAVAVTVYRQAVHDVDIDDALPVAQIVRHSGAGLGHGLQESVLIAAPWAGSAGSAGVDPALALSRADADGDVLYRPAEARHGVTLEVGEDNKGIVVGEVRTHEVLRQARTAGDGDGEGAVRVHNIHVGDGGKSVILRHLHVHGGTGAAAAIGGVALHDGAVH